MRFGAGRRIVDGKIEICDLLHGRSVAFEGIGYLICEIDEPRCLHVKACQA